MTVNYRDYFAEVIHEIERNIYYRISSYSNGDISNNPLFYALGFGMDGSTILPGSKRLRGTLFSIIHSQSNCKEQKCINVAVAAEIIHNASLIVDDLQDAHIERWNRPTLWKNFGHKIALNTAIRLIVIAEEVVKNLSERYCENLNYTILNMLNGQEFDLTARIDSENNLSNYLKIAEGKTSALFEWVAKAGSHDYDCEAIKNIANYAKYVGIAHQIQDDIDDILIAGTLEDLEPSNIAWFLYDNKRDRTLHKLQHSACDLAETYHKKAMSLLQNQALASRLLVDLNAFSHTLSNRNKQQSITLEKKVM